MHGLIAMAQISAIELHAWGAPEADPLHPDFVVFDLDPGEGVAFAEVARAATDVRDRLEQLGLQSFCRTTGGKGLARRRAAEPEADWDEVKPFCRAFAETLSEEQPDRFLPTVKKADRRGRILIDWLRNGLGATAVASFCPRARPGATVATPLAWDEVTPDLDPSRFTLHTVPDRLARQRHDPWEGFAALQQKLPDLSAKPAERSVQRRHLGQEPGWQGCDRFRPQAETARASVRVDFFCGHLMSVCAAGGLSVRCVTFPPQTWRCLRAPPFCFSRLCQCGAAQPDFVSPVQTTGRAIIRSQGASTRYRLCRCTPTRRARCARQAPPPASWRTRSPYTS